MQCLFRFPPSYFLMFIPPGQTINNHPFNKRKENEKHEGIQRRPRGREVESKGKNKKEATKQKERGKEREWRERRNRERINIRGREKREGREKRGIEGG